MYDQTQTTGITALPYTVVRIRAGDVANPQAVHKGTGFFYHFREGAGNVPLIVSNKHVLVGKEWLEFDFALLDNQGKRVFGPANTFRLTKNQLPIFEHPDPTVDLAAIPIQPIVEAMRGQGKEIFNLLLGRETIAPDNIQAILHAATSVLMVGFPSGIMDEKNNLPVVRRGILAVNYLTDYRGETNFVVDIAAFGGSSGSPVFAFFENMLPDGSGGVTMLAQPQVYFLGVLHSGPSMTATGKIVPVPVPTSDQIAQTQMMLHLGYCVKASRVEELVETIRAKISEPTASG
ncbi:trypsin-like peptidase domain-containing protein [Mesorhizobium japonicum]|uniref:Msl8587 protein n=1 Tax=Mesorhizobium japonicum (strain LMG 29417 / CECT 9101 / MAFF 303099) TaxID=266835 RepID=Q98MQ8_RHILO|nr:trypsin-like peptidase domain-containing protein [Mesorhizobium japonicum]BAB48055.1 msl8587 [Mesorhizobium japonicum MAFF 303099]